MDNAEIVREVKDACGKDGANSEIHVVHSAPFGMSLGFASPLGRTMRPGEICISREGRSLGNKKCIKDTLEGQSVDQLELALASVEESKC